MAVNKNFVVKNGLEVNTDLIIADADNNRVGIATTTPEYTLHINGGIGATDVKVSGFTTLTQGIQVGSSGSVFYVSDSNNSVGIGTSVPDSAYLLDVRSSVSTGQTALYVYGDARVTGDLHLDDVNLDAATIADLNVTGLSTFVGLSTFNDYVIIEDGLSVTGVVTTTTTLHVGTGGTVVSADSETGTFAIGSESTSITATMNGGTIPSVGLVIALGG